MRRELRIAVVTHHSIVVGGIERYLSAIIPPLRAKYEVKVFCETRLSPLRPGSQTVDTLAGVGTATYAEISAWSPDLVWIHGQIDGATEVALLELVPALYTAHDYAGACISGGKTLYTPSPQPCSRRLGVACMAHYYPHRCGGLSPLAMVRGYASNRSRRSRMHQYRAIVVFSGHMRDEMVRQGIPPERVRIIQPFSPQELTDDAVPVGPSSTNDTGDGNLHIAFVGRLEQGKGVATMLRSLPISSAALQRTLRVTICGVGTQAEHYQRVAAQVESQCSTVRISFAGNLDSAALSVLFRSLHLLVVPSVWPEPFGLVGLEAACYGVPAVAFNVGGIGEWLVDNLNGHLADGDRLDADSLAHATLQALGDSRHYSDLREGATEVSKRFTLRRHLRELKDVLSALQGFSPRS